LPVSATANLSEGEAVNVTVASSRPAVVAAWVARLAGERAIRVAGAAVPDGPALHASLGGAAPQVLLLDVAALEWLSAEGLRAQFPALRVLLVCESAGQELVEIVLRNRFAGYLVRHERTDLFIKAIASVRQGELWMPRAGLAAALQARLGDPPTEPPAEKPPMAAQRTPLTDRERQVADCLHKGFSNSEIARELGIKRDTVKKHLRSMFAKLGVQRRSEIAAAGAANVPAAQRNLSRRAALA
jgi:DNA-binding NarL/FixJ family response regulator